MVHTAAGEALVETVPAAAVAAAVVVESHPSSYKATVVGEFLAAEINRMLASRHMTEKAMQNTSH